MKQISIREFQLHAEQYLKELPITLTRYGHKICTITSTNEEYVDISKKLNPDGFKVTEKIVEKAEEQIASVVDEQDRKMANLMSQKSIRMCKHGSAIGNCKFGCKS